MLKFHIKFILILLCILFVNSVFADDFNFTPTNNRIKKISNLQEQIKELSKELQAIIPSLKKIDIDSKKQVEHITNIVSKQEEMNNKVQQQIDELNKAIKDIDGLLNAIIDKLSDQAN